MLDLSRSTLIETHLQEVASTVNTLQEGVPMIHVIENNKGVVKPATGAAGELFAGCSHSKMLRPTTAAIVENLTIVAGKANLSRTPYGVAADRGVFNASAAALTSVGSAGAVDANTKYNITGKVLTVHTDLNDTVVKVQYTYELTATEAAMLFGNDLATLDLSGAKNVGIITTGFVFTDMYDKQVNWAAVAGTSADVKLGAGVFTVGGSGGDLDAIVVHVPNPADPILGLRLHP